MVEITTTLEGTDDHEATGRLFAVQLKATDDEEAPDSLRIGTGHLRYWLNHSLPVLLVSAHLGSRVLRARWIDGELLSELRLRSPALWSQGSISVPLTETVTALTRTAVEAKVLQFRRKELAISPASFFQARDRILSLGDRLHAVATAAGLASEAQRCSPVKIATNAGSP